MVDEGVLALMIPIIAIVGMATIFCVRIFMQHQREMAKLLHGQHADNSTSAELQALRQEVERLTDVVNQQSIELDSRLARAEQADHERLH